MSGIKTPVTVLQPYEQICHSAIFRDDNGDDFTAEDIAAALNAAPLFWPDFTTRPKHEDPAEGWEDPKLPDFRLIWSVACEHGYAIGLHGSMVRDCDLIAVPWVDKPASHETLVEALCDALNARQIGATEAKTVGRIALTLQVDGYVKPIDLSIMLSQASAPKLAFEDLQEDVLFDILWGYAHGDQSCESALKSLQAFAAPVAPAWQPIETAPKDGAAFDAWTRWGRVTNCVKCAQFGRVYAYCEEAADYSRLIDATHWMPLPAAPEAQGGPDHD